MSVGMFSLERIEVGELLPELEAVFGEEGETPLAGMFRFMPLERLNAIMVITPNDHYLDEAEKWIRRLDRSSPESGARLYVYRVKNLEADILAGYLGDIFGTSGGGSRPQRENRGGLAPGMEPATVSSVSEFQSSRNQQSDSNQTQNRATAGGMQLGEEGNVRVTAVLETNSLLIQASPGEYDAILSAIKRLDEEPLQVLIEAQVLVVTLNDELRYGVNWFIANKNPEGDIPESGGEEGEDDPPPFGQSREDDFARLDGAGILATVTRRAVDRTFVTATIDALESVTDTRTISSPSLMVRNNAEASINVGSQVPVQSTRFVGGSGLDPSGQGTIGSVQYLNTGVILDVTPRVNPGGLVYLTLSQEVSTPQFPPGGGNPAIDTRNVNTEVAIQSGQTIILGGLIQETNSEGRVGIPILSRIPILGRLFGTRSKTTNRTETIVMITPTVVSTTDRLQEISDEFRNKFKGLRPMQVDSDSPDD